MNTKDLMPEHTKRLEACGDDEFHPELQDAYNFVDRHKGARSYGNTYPGWLIREAYLKGISDERERASK